jgi:hypothetical protein
MTTLGWIFLTVSLTFVWGLAGWCFYKVLTVRDDRGGASDPGRG